MKNTTLFALHRCNRRITLDGRDDLAVKVYYRLKDQLNVMRFDEATTWLSDRSSFWFGTHIGESGIRSLYFQGKHQRSRA
jgi:hypothetical protein